MEADTIAVGTLVVLGGVALLYVGRHVYPRIGLSRDALELVRLITAVLAGGLIAFGLAVVVLGMLGG